MENTNGIDEYIDLTKGKNYLGDIENELDKLLNN
jgi:hypothetical protein